MSSPESEWKPIQGYEGIYEVSRNGEVRSVTRYDTHKNPCKLVGAIKKLGDNNRGYVSVMLCQNGKARKRSVHRLVAKAFIPVIKDHNEVNHINGNKKDNSVENLEWSNRSKNLLHYFNDLGGSNPKHGDSKHSKSVMQLSLKNDLVKVWDSMSMAKDVGGFCQGHISSCCSGKRNTHGGYRWIFALT